MLLADFSLAELKEYGRTADRHDLLKRRWLTYEVDPQLAGAPVVRIALPRGRWAGGRDIAWVWHSRIPHWTAFSRLQAAVRYSRRVLRAA